jgi:hypothetical protein
MITSSDLTSTIIYQQEENDPTKIVSLFVMGEYEDLNDLVRDGSKKLRESKTLPDEEILRYNRPRQFLNLPGHGGHVSSVGGTHGTNSMIPFSPNSTHFNHANTLSPYGGDATMSGTSSNGTGGTGSDGRVRKRVFSAEKGRAIYHKVLGSTPKIKSNPRDTRASSSSNGGNGGGSSSNGRGGGGRNSSSTNNAGGGGGYHPHPYGCLGGSPLAASDANNLNKSQQQQQQAQSSNQGQQQQQQQQQSTYSPNYFPTQCNFFPNNNDWTEVLGFSVNSLWNCGANGDLTPTMSPHSNPSSPTHGAGSPTNQFSSQQQQSHGGGGYNSSSVPPQSSQYSQGPPTGYHNHQGYNSSAAANGGGGYGGGGGGSSAYNTVTPSQYNSRQDEGRNPSYGYGRGGSGAGVRDTVVM